MCSRDIMHEAGALFERLHGGCSARMVPATRVVALMWGPAMDKTHG
jgi:hypothetical protein